MSYLTFIVILSLDLLSICTVALCFNSNIKYANKIQRNLYMKWSFSNNNNGMKNFESTLTGLDGEFYFSPARSAKIITPMNYNIVGNKRMIPLLTYNNLVLPGSTDQLNIFEMRNRQLLNDVDNGVFGLLYYSQTLQKVSLVGTLCRVKSRKILEDGRVSVCIEGIDRFYLDEVITENPYLKGVVRTFNDYTESPGILDNLESQIFDGIQSNLKMMQLLYPQKNLTISNAVLQNRPIMSLPGIRTIRFGDDENDMVRRSKFSYAVLDMLQSQPPMKLSLLQEHVTEKRYLKFLNILDKGGSYLKDELRSKGLLTSSEDIMDIKINASIDQDFDVVPQASW